MTWCAKRRIHLGSQRQRPVDTARPRAAWRPCDARARRLHARRDRASPLADFAFRINSPFLLMMKRLLLLCILSMFAVAAQAAPPRSGEYIILVGGPSMYQWEKYKAVPHDHWWANFVRAARLRTDQLRQEIGPDTKITWLVYRQGYEDRAKQEHQDLVSLIGTVRDKLNINLTRFAPGQEV